MTERKRIAILGSTGSIGRQTLDVVAWHPDRFEVVALAARSDAPLFRQQVEQFKPKLAALTGASQDGWSPDETRLCFGEPSLVEIATAPDVDVLVVATSGTAGLAPTIAALELPYRVVEICTGDLGQSHHRSLDVEVFAPGADRWLEVSSVSWFSDYQARRADIRYRPEGRKGTEIAHTLNGSALAVPRVLAALHALADHLWSDDCHLAYPFFAAYWMALTMC